MKGIIKTVRLGIGEGVVELWFIRGYGYEGVMVHEGVAL